MKIALLIFFSVVCQQSFSQNMKLQNDVIYENNTAIASYKKMVHATNDATSINVFNKENKLLIKLVAKKMKAPIRELSSFYYHDIIFPGMADSFAVYNPDEALSLHLFSIIEKYQLIKNAEIDSNAVINFKKSYSQKKFNDKLDEMVKYLEDTRNYHYQVDRDRTKPVYIINEKNIMQDSILIGRFVISDIPRSERSINSNNLMYQTQQIINPGQNIDVLLPSGMRVDRRFFEDYYFGPGQWFIGKDLYNLSKPKKMNDGNYNARLLGLACCLIENYAL